MYSAALPPAYRMRDELSISGGGSGERERCGNTAGNAERNEGAGKYEAGRDAPS